MKKTFFNNCSALLRKSSKVLIISALSMFYFSTMSFAQAPCDNVQVQVIGNDTQLTSDFNEAGYVHVWIVTSKRCGDHYNNASNYGNIATLYNLACETDPSISYNYEVTHCIYPEDQGHQGYPDLAQQPLCCAKIQI